MFHEMTRPSKIEMMPVRRAFQMPLAAGSTFIAGPQDFFWTAFGLNNGLRRRLRVLLHGISAPLLFRLITMEGPENAP
jgi:hypothetical protein